jgi:hypothetical protein
MSHPGLDRSGVVAGVCQGIAAPVSEHVGVDGKWHAGALAKPHNERVEIAFLRLNVRHKPDVRKGPAKSLDLTIARRIQCGLQFDVEGVCSAADAVHRAENLDIADWIETEAARMRVSTSSTMRETAVSATK